MKTLEQQLRRQIFCLSTPPEAEVRTKTAALTHYPDTNLIQDPEPLTHRKGSINLPMLVQKELEVLTKWWRGNEPFLSTLSKSQGLGCLASCP